MPFSHASGVGVRRPSATRAATFPVSLLVSRLRDLRGTTHRVRWQVDGREENRTFATRALADSFRSDLSAARRGEPFDTATGLPVSLRPKATGPTWLAHAKALVDAKWGESSPAHRKSTAAALVTISCALTRDGVTYRDPKTPRAALLHWSFNQATRRRLTPHPRGMWKPWLGQNAPHAR